MRTARAAVVNLGCRVNRVELDAMALGLQAAGVEVVDAKDAQVVIVNTCAVTGEAEAKCRKAVRRVASLPQRPLVVATGCAVALFGEEFAELGERVRVEALKPRAVDAALGLLGVGGGAEVARPTVVAGGVTPTGRTRPGVKVQDGCDNRCSYCIVWKARGPARSIAPAEALRAVEAEVVRGASEVVLTGINLARYEAPDEAGRRFGLAELLDYLLERSSVRRLRLSSVEPPETTDDVLRVMGASAGRVAPYLHLPLQAGCDATLAEMGRAYDTARYRRVVERARDHMPTLGLACDLIVGFPGETDERFEESFAFCREMAFSHMHVFRYSPRPGTPAAARADQVPAEVKAERSARMLALSAAMRNADAASRVGLDALVVVERPGRATDGALFPVRVDERLPVGSMQRLRIARSDGNGVLLAEGCDR